MTLNGQERDMKRRNQGEKYEIRIPYDSLGFHRRFSRIP